MAGAEVQGKRKTKVGRVVSDKMDKTIVVSVERLTRHRLYKRVMKATTSFVRNLAPIIPFFLSKNSLTRFLMVK